MALLWISIISSSNIFSSTDLREPKLTRTLQPKIMCLMVGSRRKCIVESPPPQSDANFIWSGFIGIGPARTGSSNLLWSLELHPQIQVGLPSLNGQDCCPASELQFFYRDNLFDRGIEYYKEYFEPRKPNTLIAGEKTPAYSDHPLVPYRIRGTLGPNVKLLFTLRDPVEAWLSLYNLRKEEEKGVTIIEYYHRMIQDQKVYDLCVNATLDVLLSPSGFASGLYYDLLQSVDRSTAMLFDEAIMKCWQNETSLKYHKERLHHYFYKENLIRWHKVMPNQVLCIWNDEYLANPLKSLNVVLEHLNVDQLPPSFTVPSQKKKNTNERKLQLKKQLGSLYWEMCDLLKKRNRGIEDLCPRMWPGEWEWCVDTRNSSLKK